MLHWQETLFVLFVRLHGDNFDARCAHSAAVKLERGVSEHPGPNRVHETVFIQMTVEREIRVRLGLEREIHRPIKLRQNLQRSRLVD